MIKNILITGANGQLGRELQELVKRQEKDLPDVYFHFTDRSTLDITDIGKLREYVDSKKINTIVNCAAYTAVDNAEKNHELTYRINAEAVKHMAELSLQKSIRLIHLSTDYVYEDNKHTPINEEDATSPQSIYAKSKLAGEEEIKSIKTNVAHWF